jgi:hypothetical protein
MGRGVAVGELTMEDSTVGTTVTSPTYPNPTPVTIKMTAMRVRCNHVCQVVLIIVCFPDLLDPPKVVPPRLARWAYAYIR